MSKKKIVTVCLVVALLATGLIGGSLAYFTDEEAKTNTFTVGNVDIVLDEPNWEGQGSEDAPEVYPGEALAKDPIVTNDGENPCFVRIKVTGLDSFGKDNMITYRTGYQPGALGANWVLHTDGYFYYHGVLAKDAVTSPLFEQIVIPTGIGNGDATTEYNVVVYAEAVQAQGARPSFSAVEAMTVAEIAEWFGTCMPADAE